VTAPPLDTVTHARLRARQGDARTARTILRSILAADPSNVEARTLLDEIGKRPDLPAAEPPDEALAAPRPARASELGGRFREALAPRDGPAPRRTIERLRALLERLEVRGG
jgi:hypothetical protein